MSDTKSTVWRQSHIIDMFSRPKRPYAIAAAVLAAVVAVDTILALSLSQQRNAPDQPVENAWDLRAQLRLARDSGPKPWLLLGDSVLAGDVMADTVRDWKDERVVDFLRRDAQPDSGAEFYQVALNGMLPVDMLRVVRELDRIDPARKTSVALELNPRFFSRYYTVQAACTREWLSDAGAPIARGGRIDRLHWWALQVSMSAEWLGTHAPVYRFKKYFPYRLPLGPDAGFTTAAPGEGPGALEGQARILEHYRDLSLGETSAQVRALRELVDRLRATGREAILFATPLNDAFMREASPDASLGGTAAALASIVNDADHPNVRLVNLDDPMFVPEYFVDHCHMLPEGNRLLAGNLLHAMNVPMREAMTWDRTVYPEGPDGTLVWNAQRGHSDGAAWQALFDQPDGIAMDGVSRIVIADTENHCLRELNGNPQTVRTIAGAPETPGMDDGPVPDAKLDTPRCPVILGDAVYFIDGGGSRLRRYRRGHVSTEYALGETRWGTVRQLRRAKDWLCMLDDSNRVLAFHPATHECAPVVEGHPDFPIACFDATDAGQLFVADGANRIWTARIDTGLALGSENPDNSPALVFPNTGAEFQPMSGTFPYAFDAIRLNRAMSMRFIERYGGILVQDEAPAAKETDDISDRVHLRFVDIRNGLVFPWLKPNVYGRYIRENKSAGVLTSQFSYGSMEIDQATGTMFYLERDRSRLFYIEDGMWGVAKLGHINSAMATFAFSDPYIAVGPFASNAFAPERYLTTRWERVPRKGPYIGVFYGSSLTAVSDMVGAYSLGRALERLLQRRLGMEQGARFDLVCRTIASMRLDAAIEAFDTFVNSGGRADAVMIELRSNVTGIPSETELMNYLVRLRTAADKYGTAVIFFDNDAMTSDHAEGLRGRSARAREYYGRIVQAGFPVLDLTPALVGRYLDVNPWGSPPYELSVHASPWAIDATAELLAGRAYPLLASHLKDRAPALLRPETPHVEVDPNAQLGTAFAQSGYDWGALALPPIDRTAVQSKFAAGKVSLLIDLAKLPAYSAASSQDDLEWLALAAAYRFVYSDPIARAATEASVTLATFSNYDEYGAGALQGANIAFERRFDRPALQDFIAAVVAKRRPDVQPGTVAAVAATKELLVNGAFEQWDGDSPAGWASKNMANWVRRSSEATAGAALELLDGGAHVETSVEQPLSDGPALVGKSLRIRLQMKVNTPSSGGAMLSYAVNGKDEYVYAWHTGSGQWETLAILHDIPADADPASIRLMIYRRPAAPGALLADQVTAEIVE